VSGLDYTEEAEPLRERGERRERKIAHAGGTTVREISILQEELCAYLHVTQGYLSKIERGKTCSQSRDVDLLSERFHKSVDLDLAGRRALIQT